MTDYGRGAAAQRREWLHQRITEMTTADELPTTVSSLYYDGVQVGRWPSDSDAARAGRKRMPRQDVSDDVQWLIDRGHVPPDAVVDFSRHVANYHSPVDLLQAAYTYVSNEALSPWEGPVPLVIVESRSLHSALDPIAEQYSIALAPLSGMSSRSFLRHDVARLVGPNTPIGFMGDLNHSGHDIERNAQRFIRHRVRGWHDDLWTLLAVTDDDARTLPRVTKIDRRCRPPRRSESVEAEALGTTELRRRLTAWLDGQLPDGFTWDEHEARTRTQRDDVLQQLVRGQR